jgi:hypothetical protein
MDALSTVLAALVVGIISATIALLLLWRSARFWKLIAQESQASTNFWRRQYEGQLCGDYIGQRSWVSVEREGPSQWVDVDGIARGRR